MSQINPLLPHASFNLAHRQLMKILIVVKPNAKCPTLKGLTYNKIHPPTFISTH